MIEFCGLEILRFDKYEATKDDPFSKATIDIQLKEGRL